MRMRFLLLLPIVMLSACAGYYSHQNQSDAANRDKLQVDNPALYTQISLRDVKQRRVGDLLTVQMTVHHESMVSHKYRYRLEWTDAGGFALANDATGWQPVTLAGNQDIVVEGTAPSAAAQNFRLVFAAQ
jgi:uncharacterized protein YcfL